MKNPLDSMSGTVWTGLIVTALLALLTNVIPSGYNVSLAIVIVLWLILFGMMRKPA